MWSKVIRVDFEPCLKAQKVLAEGSRPCVIIDYASRAPAREQLASLADDFHRRRRRCAPPRPFRAGDFGWFLPRENGNT